MMVVFRTDASVVIGTGHVMRCLTLAGALCERGVAVSFVCRDHDGNMGDLIAERGFEVTLLPAPTPRYRSKDAPVEAAWLGALWQDDAEQTRAAIDDAGTVPGWLVVDHYTIDRRWESAVRKQVRHVMVIDDLADRPHDCDLLLDQNFDNSVHGRYAELLPAGARQLLGTRYALVRPEFLRHREVALSRRDGRVRRLLVSMGGSDPDNDTATVLAGLATCTRDALAVDVVLGKSNPHRQEIYDLCKRIPMVELHVQTSKMAELMTRADLAINGGGSTTWERCVLGLPGIVAIQSNDQAAIAQAIQQIGGQRVLGRSGELTARDYGRAIDDLTPDELIRMSTISAGLCDGVGADRIATQLMNWSC